MASLQPLGTSQRNRRRSVRSSVTDIVARADFGGAEPIWQRSTRCLSDLRHELEGQSQSQMDNTAANPGHETPLSDAFRTIPTPNFRGSPVNTALEADLPEATNLGARLDPAPEETAI